jgi:hypothetical protein
MTNRPSHALKVALLLALARTADPAPEPEPPPHPFLRRVIQLDAAQLAAVEKGELVTKLLPGGDPSEIAAFGVVKCSGTAERLLRLARDVRRFRKGPRIAELGLFSAPPRLEDLAALTHPPDDIAALRSCRSGSCDVKLGTRGLELVSRLDWSASGAEREAVLVLNRGIVEYVAAYQAGGTAALGDILDKKAARLRSHEHEALLASSPYLTEYVGELARHLAAYPASRLSGAEDLFYWAKDASGPKPLVAAYHATLYRGPHGALIVNRLLGATHFFNAALDVMAGVDAPDGRGLYLMSLYRTRLDPPTGRLAGLLMGKVKDGVETGVRESLVTAKARLAATP